MADFSKQYCETHDPELPWDFDIEEIAGNISNEYCIPMICEGYGFIAIGKNESGEIILGFREESDRINWKLYSEIIVQ
jgi:hypothetical protein